MKSWLLRKALAQHGLTPLNIIQPLLRSKGISQGDIAKHLGVSQAYVSQVISGKRDCPEIRETIVSVLGFDPWA